MLTQEHIEWIEANVLMFTTSQRMQREHIQQLFSMYSIVSGKLQRPTGCGACIRSALNAVWKQYQKQIAT